MSIKTFLRTTDRIANVLHEYDIKSPEDFFYNFPREYEDRSTVKTIDQLSQWEKHTIKVEVLSKNYINTRTGKRMIEIKVQDEKENIAFLSFMNNAYGARSIQVWDWILATGKPKHSYGKWVMWFPEVVKESDGLGEKSAAEADFSGKIVPIYSEMMGIKSNWFAKKVYERLDMIPEGFDEYLPQFLLDSYGLIGIHRAIRSIHFPDNMKELYAARRRIYFERLFVWQLLSNYQKILADSEQTEKDIVIKTPDRDVIKDFLERLPFELTKAQKRATKAIIDDFYKPDTMLRLLQWDVWSGKTVVALLAAYYMNKKHGKQAAFMVPTEVLANQHIKEVAKYFLPLGLRPALLAGSTKAKEKEKIKQELLDGTIDIVIWTHALIQDDVKFKDLGFVIIDEQHKFGVNQRWKLKAQWNPHILQMTATPIPRSLALSFFGEFENTVIDELPPGRSPIYTKVTTEWEFKRLKQFFVTKIQQWQQIYIVTPLIEESEKMEDVQSSMKEFEEVRDMFYELWANEVWLLHGKMKAEEKEQVMKQFKAWKIKILIATTVIEVWIDVAAATIMVIKNAERFGLSQLHQLRGRVWRSDLKSYCFLISKATWWDTYRRLKSMEKYTDGFKLAEIDLEMRWAGTILWTRQSGQMDIPDEVFKDIRLLEDTRMEARRLLKSDPKLEKYSKLKKIMKKYAKGEDILV